MKGKKDRSLKTTDLHLKAQTGPRTSGHDVDFGTFTVENGSYTPWISKLNKGGNPVNSVLEVAFSEVATLFIRPGLTPPARVIRNENGGVFGVASEHLSIHIKRQQDQKIKCFEFNPNAWEFKPVDTTKVDVAIKDPELDSRFTSEEDKNFRTKSSKDNQQLKKAQKGVHFLEKMGKNFFPTLMEKHGTGEVEIDMESLASIFTASYVLEEDDLHKGNIGFYVTETEAGKKKFTFFKIDHDMMFIDSIMSRNQQARPANWLYGSDSFKITVRDLEGFPDLKDSGNHYWPTRTRVLAAGDKQYANKEETEAFASLKGDPAFTSAKWNYFLKCCVMPKELITNSLTMHLDANYDKDKIDIIQNAVSKRMIQLQQALLSSPQFLAYMRSEAGKAAKKGIMAEIQAYMNTNGVEQEIQENMLRKVGVKFDLLVHCVETKNISRLAKTIMLDCYEFSSKVKPSDQDIGFAQLKLKQHIKNAEHGANAFKYACIIIDMIRKSDAKEDLKVLKVCNEVKETYLKPKLIKTFADFLIAADKIRTSDLPLKQQKNEILAVLKEAKLNPEALEKLQKDLKKYEPVNPSLKFIKQLRSDFWFIRVFRGFFGGIYGTTTTSSCMLKEINTQIATISETAKGRTQDFKNEIELVRVQATKEEVQATKEEVQATKEEVQATKEEVQATEEEVQATEEEPQVDENTEPLGGLLINNRGGGI